MPDTAVTSSPTALRDERLWTIAELAGWLRVSRDTGIRLFENEPGVIILGNAMSKPGRRRYRKVLVPDSVAQRFFRRHSVVRQYSVR